MTKAKNKTRAYARAWVRAWARVHAVKKLKNFTKNAKNLHPPSDFKSDFMHAHTYVYYIITQTL